MQIPLRTICLALLASFLAAEAFAAPAANPAHELTLTKGSRLLIAAKINGRPVTALLDSAAEASILDTAFAQELKLGSGKSVEGKGSGKESFDASLVNDVTLQALGLTIPGQTVAVADLGDVGQRLLDRRLDVILGREIFDASRLSIDIEGTRIFTVSRDHEPRGIRLGLTTEHAIETIPVRVETDEPVRATFDLGNGSKVLISAAFAARRHLLSDGRSVTTEQGGGLGGEATRQVVILKSLVVAGHEFKDVPAALDAHPNTSDLNVGVSILRHFRITTDFVQRAVWLEPRD